MTRAELALMLDHSVLKPEASARDVLEGAKLVLDWRIGFYCVQPGWVRIAAQALAGSGASVVSVVGFPHGCDLAVVKARAAALAIADGAGEIDMVINFGLLRSGETQAVAAEIMEVVRAVPSIPVKVIIETRALSDGEKRLACGLVRDSGAAFVKTSTGFHPAGGATVQDVRLLRSLVGPDFGVKASGGIRSLADARTMLDAGANRIGTSASATILEALPAAG
ncbi:MAG: deoxyribose-phosphate aldolase [Betaproteobacteria bacterium]|nr:deoxyribose-phosphate aldolase [Betaproteobacteria bacterium]